MVKNGTTYRLLRDHLGSVRLVVDASTGFVAQRLSYGPWGTVLEDTNPGFQPLGYAGGLYDPDTGLVRFGVRDYDPSVGRWLAKDPAGVRIGSNLYEYCQSDPINSIDSTGLALTNTQTWWVNEAIGLIRGTPGYEAYADQLQTKLSNGNFYSDNFWGPWKDDAAHGNTATGNITLNKNINTLHFIDQDYQGTVTKLTAQLQCGKITQSQYDRMLVQLYKHYRENLFYLAETLAHEGQHAVNGWDENRAYPFEGQFLTDLAGTLTNPSEIAAVRSLHNNAVSDAWGKERIRIPAPTY